MQWGFENHVILSLKSQRSFVPFVLIIISSTIRVEVASHNPQFLIRILRFADSVVKNTFEFFDTMLFAFILLRAFFLLFSRHSITILAILKVNSDDVDWFFNTFNSYLIPAAVIHNNGVWFMSFDYIDTVDRVL